MTICAISTAPGVGGIAVIRISGELAFTACDAIFKPFTAGVTVSAMVPNTIRFGQIVADNELVDEVLVSVFHAPHSFTGENVVEIACHGSQFIQQEILKLVLAQGCRLAQPGEFTQRAFLNGKMDLSQAEAVADVIASQSRAAHRLAMNQMRGGFSNELLILRDKLLTFTSLVELELDFSDHEDLEFADRSQLNTLADTIEQKIAKLVNSFSVGNAIKNGIPVAIVGETNAGKSTLLNVLLNEERAIVSDIHGTTRDVIEDTVNIKGVLFRFIDTAGLRETTDTIENLGIERTYQAIEKANIVLWIIDTSQINNQEKWLSEEIMKRVEHTPLILVFNKVDKLSEGERLTLEQQFKDNRVPRIFISAKERLHTDELQELLYNAAKLPELSDQDIMVTNMRHYEALKQAHTAIVRVQDGLNDRISGDFLSQDIRECLHYLGEITGQITTDEVLGNIFSKFCIGK
ncbi:MAG: tRNA uridine-5-carboxymethylaminomethyl(34) synthesis GTPase MnmE [Paludibacteraceae bacterium]|nr:tRNA uridine-5-carboxymethylaminomethyl(34) synthesis GTPase MnmE [Paludibacteraceae bacterium]